MSERSATPKLVANRQEGGSGYWTSEQYAPGKWRQVWVQVTPRTRGPQAGGGVDARVVSEKKPFVPPTFVAKLSEALDAKQDDED